MLDSALKRFEQGRKVTVLIVISHAKEQNRRARHGFHSFNGRIRICALGVVDICYAILFPHKLDAVFHAGECTQPLADFFRVHAHAKRKRCSAKRVFHIMAARDLKRVGLYQWRLHPVHAEDHPAIPQEHALGQGLLL